MIVSRFERVLFVNPPYGAIGVKESVSNVSVVLSLAMLAGITRMLGSEVRILDMNLFDNDAHFSNEIGNFNLLNNCGIKISKKCLLSKKDIDSKFISRAT
jgi:hypothetical protein